MIIEDGLGASATYNRMSDEMQMAISRIAQENNVPIYAHAINLDEFYSAVKMSSRAIVHGLEDPIPPGDTILQDMVENNVALVPTHSLWEAFLRHDEAAVDLDDPLLRASVPHFLLDYMQDPGYRAEETRRFLKVAGMSVLPVGRRENPCFSREYSQGAPGRGVTRHGNRRGGDRSVSTSRATIRPGKSSFSFKQD